jgi:hypothetical protein
MPRGGGPRSAGTRTGPGAAPRPPGSRLPHPLLWALTRCARRDRGHGLWMPEVGGRVDWHAEEHEQIMLALRLSSKREITRTRIRMRTAMAAQTREEGRYLGGRPPYGYRLADAGPHPNKAHAAWGRRAHRLEPDPVTARWCGRCSPSGWPGIAPRGSPAP